ncbi:hypothetical protein [Kitasatospora sp. NPDC087314]|uniref:hypothetical protein n=1 Tax=Kitasatospora sp. NPDC087314 TaxID=3364068 RepID=UPI003801FEC4
MKATKTMRHTAMAVMAGALTLAGTMAQAGTAQADDASSGDGLPRISMNEGGPFYPGKHLDTGYTTLIFQADGNLVDYKTVGLLDREGRTASRVARVRTGSARAR